MTATPRVTVKYRENEVPYVEVWVRDTLIVAGWVHEEPYPCYVTDDEEDTYDDEDGEYPWQPIVLPAEEIIDPPLTKKENQ